MGTHGGSRTHLNNFQIYYDFTQNKGNISFDMTRTNYTSYLSFDLPAEVIVKSVVWKNKEKLYTNGTDYTQEQNITGSPKYLSFTLSNRNITYDYHSEILIEFEGKLYTNANFEFSKYDLTIVPPHGYENGIFFKFNLGGKYYCIYQPCFESYFKGSQEIEIHSLGNELGVSTKKKPTSDWEDFSHHRFRLNYNKENNKLFEFIRDWTPRFIFLGLLPFIETLLLIFYKIKKWVILNRIR